jgi:hypothetical protein
MKICSKCELPKELNDFSLKKTGKDGYNSYCKSCKKQYDEANGLISKKYKKNYRKVNNKKIKLYDKNYRTNNPNYHKDYVLKNKEKIKKYVKDNNEVINKNKRKYRDNNPEKVRESNNNWLNKNPHIPAWRSVLTSSLKRLGKSKEGHTIDLLGYSATDLKIHIESLFTEGMSWDNHGEWHIDHIKPVCLYPNHTHPSIVNSLSNLRPLWATTREINGIIYEGNLNKY